ncbi:unnamed protein product [Acanthoscelides obtectus]|uniref:Reverse transcriptase domain-containing protein n=1 Tax=Acanthoscelides obtectus TaxID=200917 RepID=A0A9P0LP96_ACAOB|nr:unnamed protein product [Acanthoscelides obtectus]CAK1621341.1 Probable RNA-directed DNA polymerase from transposon X-element [Acanthoscelides obtectus]
MKNGTHFRAIIYYNFQRQLSQQVCLAELLSVFGNEAPHQSTSSRWYGEFKRGWVSLSDDPRVGAPKTAVTQEIVDAVRKLMIKDRHVTYREIEASLKISKTLIQKILHEELGVRKLVSRWIPHLLTDEQKAARVNWCQKTLDRFNSGNSKNLYSIKIHVWVFQDEEKPTKVIRSRSVSKKMVTIFVTVTVHWYTITCLPKVITELRKINPERRIILHQDNAKLLDHPPYSPDLSPNDFFTFPKIKNRLRGQRFQSPEEAVDTFKNAVLDPPANEWNKCFENCVAKVFEKVLSTRTIRYLTKFKILSENQYGFTEGKATSDAITKIVNQIYQNIDNRIPSICIFVDLKKAFDTVNHKLLLEALERIGFRGNAYSLIESYLSNRPQSVQISGSFSKEMYIKCGVPQRTVLGPLLFNIYLNDIFQINCVGKITSFADDTAILYEGTDWSDLKNVIENDFIKIIRWFNSRKLSINYSKTHFLPFGSYARHLPNYTNFSFNINDQKIFVSYKIKYLGNILTEKYLQTLYHALIEPHLTYGILAWGAACSSHIYNLDVFQKSILKMIFKKPKLYPTEKLYADVRMYDIRQLYFLHSITHYHKFVNTDQKLNIIIIPVVPQPHKSIMQRSYLYLAPKFYKIIPKDLKDLRFGNCFKRNLKKWLHSISRTEIHKLINTNIN